MADAAATRYEQLAEDVGEAIREGLLRPGERLPRCARLASAAASAPRRYSRPTGCWSCAG